MAQQSRIGRVATSVFTDTDDFTKVVYHSTAVVKFNTESIILNSGGWKTATTKTRMNQASAQFNLGYQVYQKNHDWYVKLANGNILDYQDNMEIPRMSAKGLRGSFNINIGKCPKCHASHAAESTCHACGYNYACDNCD